MIKNTFFIGLFTFFISSISFAEDPYAGQYKVLDFPEETTTSNGKVEVLEFFWYGCPHCSHIEAPLNNWLKTKADYIEFKRVPAVFHQTHGWAFGAKAYYIADALDMLDTIHGAIFNAIHNSKPKQYDIIQSKDGLRSFFEKHGVKAKKFNRVYRSFWIYKQLNTAVDTTAAYDLNGVPAIIVNGKYKLPGEKFSGYKNMMKVVDYLAAKEYQASNNK
ncbi:thiol:disulfide interchange protein DsbA/DsbL [Candidatus Marithrix sp. Canyon 246]|uniref:thiol:disulfide interchange protein DsbA/DsbL n=1 Tax=Candidatus Marithrix sp. Canyon 246 TaxID=1827136 RepID=UPI000849F7BF|nr:thiol:disulfide interchange protein DsbA/DsbL [Candidatus Marithrix sp. Canyon 246]